MAEFDTNNERNRMLIDGVRSSLLHDIARKEPVKTCRDFILWAHGAFPQSMTDFVGMTHTGQREDTRTQPKGLFTRTSYTDRQENETEHGYRNIADRIMRNIVRNWDELKKKGHDA